MKRNVRKGLKKYMVNKKEFEGYICEITNIADQRNEVMSGQAAEVESSDQV